MVYTVGPQADPRGIVRQITEALAGMGMGTFAANHEFMNSQYEINLRHAPALTAADRAFRLKSAVKDIAAMSGLVATFMGKPFNDQGGSGFHLHISADRDDDNAFADRDDPDGVSDELRRFTAGVLAHAPALMAFLNPTINAYRRIVPDSLAPISINWGWDNRTAFVRIPAERGRATRMEIRIGDGSANPYLAIAATLFAGLHGLREELPLSDPVVGDAYTQGEDGGGAIPLSLDAALDALEADDVPARRDRGGDRRPVRGHEAVRARAPPRVDLGLGARRVPPPPLGAADDDPRDHRPLQPRRVRRRASRTSGSGRCAARRPSSSTPSRTARASTRSRATPTSARCTATSTCSPRRSAARRSRTSTRTSSRRASR